MPDALPVVKAGLSNLEGATVEGKVWSFDGDVYSIAVDYGPVALNFEVAADVVTDALYALAHEEEGYGSFSEAVDAVRLRWENEGQRIRVRLWGDG